MIFNQKFSKKKLLFSGRIIYGIIIMLALIESFEYSNTSSANILGSVFGSLCVIAVAEIFIKQSLARVVINPHKIKSFKKLFAKEIHILIAFMIPFSFFSLEILEIINKKQAFVGTQSVSTVALFLFGYQIARINQKPFVLKMASGFLSAIIGLIIIGLKILVH